MQIDEKLIKIFLERLPADVKTILASGSQDLTVSQPAEMVDRMIEAQRFQRPSAAKISTSSSTDFAGALFCKAVFSEIDLVSAFHQISVAPEDIPETAVITPFGLFEFIHMSFGLRNAAQTFQSHVQLDVVDSSPPSNGYTHLLTCNDRYTRWAEAISLPNMQAETIVKAFASRCVAMLGVPSTVTTDRGRQFESALFQTFPNFLGCTRILTTTHHLAANGMVGRFHRHLKTALFTAEDPGN
nr:unnamed protein product [Spirometra erinaceieuropaei]